MTDKDGAPVAGAEVTILVQGTDQILSTTSDASGAWALQLDVEPGAVLEVNGTGPTTTTEPDADGCITTTTVSGQLEVTIPAEGPADPVALALDREISGTVCSATRHARHRPGAHAPADRHDRAGERTGRQRVAAAGRGPGGVDRRDGRPHRRPGGRTAADPPPGGRHDRAAAPSIQPSPRVTRRTRSSSSSSTTCARRPASSRPRSAARAAPAGSPRPRRPRPSSGRPSRRGSGPPCRARSRSPRACRSRRASRALAGPRLQPADRPDRRPPASGSASLTRARSRSAGFVRATSGHSAGWTWWPSAMSSTKAASSEQRGDREARVPVVHPGHRVEQVGRRTAPAA